MDERLAPGVQHGEEADRGAEVARVGGYRPERVGDGSEEQAVDDGLVLGGDLGDGRGYGEDDVEVLGGQQVRAAPFEPLGARQRLAGWTVAVAARVVTRRADGRSGHTARRDRRAQRCGTARWPSSRGAAPWRGRPGPGIGRRRRSGGRRPPRRARRAARPSLSRRAGCVRRWAAGAGPADWRSSRPWWSRPAGSARWSAGSDARAGAEWCAGRCRPRAGGPRRHGEANAA